LEQIEDQTHGHTLDVIKRYGTTKYPILDGFWFPNDFVVFFTFDIKTEDILMEVFLFSMNTM